MTFLELLDPLFFVVVFFLNFGGHMSFYGATDTLFWTSGDVSFVFQSQSGQPYSNLTEVYVMYIQ